MTATLIRFPIERTKKAELDRALAYADKVLRLCRLSDRRMHVTFRRDQVRAVR